MKKTCLAFFLIATAGCRTSENIGRLESAATQEASASGSTISCSRNYPDRGEDYIAILTFDQEKFTLTIKQSSSTARYAAITHELLAETSSIMPQGEPKFECSTSPKGPDRFYHSIRVFDDSFAFLQSSIRARFAPIVYKFKSAESN
jgi:hypothetical protein